MTGRKPKTAAQQIAEGDPRKRGPHKLQDMLNAEPPATKGLPSCPDHLHDLAREAWEFWSEELGKMDLDCRCDAPMLAGACWNYHRAIQAELQLDQEGMTVAESVWDEKSGEKIVLKIKSHPANSIRARAWALVARFCSEFGLSPVSRTRLAVDRKPKLQDLSEILSKPRDQPAVN